MENVSKHINIKFVTTDRERNYLVSVPNYPTKKLFSEILFAIEMKKIKVKMNKPIYLGLSKLENSNTICMGFSMVILNQSISAM